MSSKNPLELSNSPGELVIQSAHEMLVRRGVFPSCVNCELWGENANHAIKASRDTKQPMHENEVCTKWGRRPPAIVIVVGCKSHIPDIPF